MDLSVVTQVSLVSLAFFAGLISSIAGSGGILTLPALLWAGLPPLNALATNKVQSSIGTLSSAWNFFRNCHGSDNNKVNGSLSAPRRAEVRRMKAQPQRREAISRCMAETT